MNSVITMNMLRKLSNMRSPLMRLMSNSTGTARNIVIEPLAEREVLRVHGQEVETFMQGLITNDMRLLQQTGTKNTSMYTMFLNKAGRILYDAIIYRTDEPDAYFVECDKCVANELKRHLRLYRVRRKIDIDSVDNAYTPWVVYTERHNTDLLQNQRLFNDMISAPDPRLPDLGVRVLLSADKSWMDLAKLISKPGVVNVAGPTSDFNYRLHRYRLGIGEGVQDLPPGKCFPLEANCDWLHGVSFQKGCYIGQELTARVFHTGVIRKRLMPLRLTHRVAENVTAIQLTGGVNVGMLRGVCMDRALALMRVEHALNANELVIDEDACYAEKPHWWPNVLARKASVSEGA